MKALGIRKENSRHPKNDVKNLKGPSQISLEHSTHRPPRSFYRASADQSGSPVDPISAASSPTGGTHLGESYFGRSAPSQSNGKIGGLYKAMSTLFLRKKKSTSAEAILSIPPPITPITPRIQDFSACSSPPAGTMVAPRPAEAVERELDPVLITYSSEEDDDEEEGDVPLLGFGGFESRPNGLAPSEGSRSFGLVRAWDAEPNGPPRRLSQATSEPMERPQRVYDSSYPQHTHKPRDDSWIDTDTVTSDPSSPPQGTIYIPSAVQPPYPPSTHPIREHSDGLDDDSEEEDEVLEISRRPRTQHVTS